MDCSTSQRGHRKSLGIGADISCGVPAQVKHRGLSKKYLPYFSAVERRCSCSFAGVKKEGRCTFSPTCVWLQQLAAATIKHSRHPPPASNCTSSKFKVQRPATARGGGHIASRSPTVRDHQVRLTIQKLQQTSDPIKATLAQKTAPHLTKVMGMRWSRPQEALWPGHTTPPSSRYALG